jgi:hypothetical protein
MARLFSFYFQRLNGPLVLTSKCNKHIYLEFCYQSFVVVGKYNDLDIENP